VSRVSVHRLKGLWETLAVYGTTPRAVRLVWDASPRHAALQLGISVFHGFQPVAQAWLSKLVVDAVARAVMAGGGEESGAGGVGASAEHLMAALAPLSGILLLRMALSLTMNCLWAPNRFISQQLGDHVTRDVNHRILAKANSFRDIRLFESPSFHDTLLKAQSESSYRPINMMNNFQNGLRELLQLVSMLVVLAAFSPAVAALLVALSVPNVYVLFRQGRESWAINNWTIPEVRAMGYLRRLLTDKNEAKEIRLFGLGDYFLRQHGEAFRAFHARYSAMRRRHWRWNTGLAVLAAAGSAVALSYGVVQALRGAISLGDLVLYTAAMTQVQGTLNGISWQISGVHQGNLFIGNLFRFLDLPETMPAPPAGTARPAPVPMREGIALEHVGFRYDPDGKDVLKDVSLTIEPGQTVALVGENGAGKTTLVKLLSRLYDPTAGRIMVDGVDLREYDVESWRRQVSVVFQDFTRFNMVARENIALGDVARAPELAAVQAAAVRGGADELIARLPDGYETMLGRRFSQIGHDGVDLSGGEWQKVALSRAFFRSLDDGTAGAQLLILDEPTAALDARAEHELYERFRELTRGKATLLISHRFSTVRMADVIAVMEDGRITELGSHDALIARGGTYARLYAMQAERYA
jgi:ATP-binding cassette subfamily B protein